MGGKFVLKKVLLVSFGN